VIADRTVIDEDRLRFTTTVPNKHYTSLKSLVTEINKSINRVYGINKKQKGFKSYVTITGDNKIQWDARHAKYSFSKHMAAILGFAETVVPYGDLQRSEYVGDILASSHSMYFYCNLVSPDFVGDKRLPLLRIVPFVGKKDHTITQEFDTGFYKNLRTSELDDILISVTNGVGDYFPFTKGPVIVTLHIRPR